MKTTYTMSEYIASPLSTEAISVLDKRHKIKVFASWSLAIVSSVLAFIFTSSGFEIISLILLVSVYISARVALECVPALMEVHISDNFVVHNGYTKSKGLYTHLMDFNPDAVLLLKANVEALGRDYIQLDRDVIQQLYLDSLANNNLVQTS